MTNHRRWMSLLLCAVMTLSSVTVLAAEDGADRAAPQAMLAGAEQEGKAIAAPVPAADEESAEEAPAETSEAPEAQPEPGEEPEEAEEAEEPEGIRLILNGEPLDLAVAPVLVGGNTYVSIRAFAEAMGCTVTWTPDGLVTVTREGELTLEIQTDSDLISANGRFFYMPDICRSIDGNLMVPIRGLAYVFTLEVVWQPESQTVVLTGGAILASAEAYYDADALLWLSRIIHCESRGEPLEGKIAVGNVVLNRTQASQFPDTIYDVIFDKKNGVQFTPTKTGSIYTASPTAESVLAAKLCLEGFSEVEDALYFLSSKAKPGWIVKNRTLVAVIGGHSFFS